MNSAMKRTLAYIFQFSSVQFSHSVVSNSLQPHESQHARHPCLLPTSGVHSNSRPSSWWCHPAISSSVVPFSFCPQSFPASESFPRSQCFTQGGQSTGVSALASFLPKNTQCWSPLEWTGWISLQSKGLSKSLLQHHSLKTSILQHSPFHSRRYPPSAPFLGLSSPWWPPPLHARSGRCRPHQCAGTPCRWQSSLMLHRSP